MENKNNVIYMEEVKKRKELINLYQTGLDGMVWDIVEQKRVRKEIEETMEYIFNEFVGSKVANPDDWYMAEYEPKENCGDCR